MAGKLRAIQTVSCLLQGPCDAGNRALELSGVMESVIALCASEREEEQLVAVEALIHAAGKAKRASFITANGVSLLKDLYKRSEKDSIRIRALVVRWVGLGRAGRPPRGGARWLVSGCGDSTLRGNVGVQGLVQARGTGPGCSSHRALGRVREMSLGRLCGTPDSAGSTCCPWRQQGSCRAGDGVWRAGWARLVRRVERLGLQGAPGAGGRGLSGLHESMAAVHLGALHPGFLHPIRILALAGVPVFSPHTS